MEHGDSGVVDANCLRASSRRKTLSEVDDLEAGL